MREGQDIWGFTSLNWLTGGQKAALCCVSLVGGSLVFIYMCITVMVLSGNTTGDKNARHRGGLSVSTFVPRLSYLYIMCVCVFVWVDSFNILWVVCQLFNI